jgi:capsular polysaccharide biosynthesis protein
LNPATQARIAASFPVAERVQEELAGEESARSLLENTTVTQIPESNILTLTSEADDPEKAATIANLFAQEFLTVSAERARDDLGSQLESLRNQIAFTQRRLDRALRQQTSSRALRNLLGRELERLSAEANGVELQLREEPRTASLVGPATPPEAPIAQAMSPVVLALAAGVTGGLLLIAFVLLQEHFSDRVRAKSDVMQLLGVPVLAALRSSFDPQGDELRLLANNLHHEMVRQRMRALLVTHLPAGIETAGIVSNVAPHLTEADRKVVVVDASTETTSGAVVGSVNRASPTETATDNPSVKHAALGPIVQTPTPLTSPAAEKLLAELEAEWDTVLVDGPEATSADAFILGASVDGIVLIVRTDQTPQTQLTRAREELARTDTPLLGAVVLTSAQGIPLREN